MLALRIASLPVTAIAVSLGVWIAGGWISDDFRVSMALTAVWFTLAGAAAATIAWKVRAVRVPVIAGYALSAIVIGGYLAAATLRDRVVDEQIVVAAPLPATTQDERSVKEDGPVALLRSRFRSHEHDTRGTATLVRLPDARRYITLTGFVTSPGPDLRVRLVPGDTPDGGAAGNVDLGALKGNRGNQQYAVPRGVRVRGASLVIWCRAFSAPFGSARLA